MTPEVKDVFRQLTANYFYGSGISNESAYWKRIYKITKQYPAERAKIVDSATELLELGKERRQLYLKDQELEKREDEFRGNFW